VIEHFLPRSHKENLPTEAGTRKARKRIHALDHFCGLFYSQDQGRKGVKRMESRKKRTKRVIDLILALMAEAEASGVWDQATYVLNHGCAFFILNAVGTGYLDKSAMDVLHPEKRRLDAELALPKATPEALKAANRYARAYQTRTGKIDRSRNFTLRLVQ